MSLVAFKKGGMTPGLHLAPSLIMPLLMGGVQEAATNKRAIEKVKMQFTEQCLRWKKRTVLNVQGNAQ